MLRHCNRRAVEEEMRYQRKCNLFLLNVPLSLPDIYIYLRSNPGCLISITLTLFEMRTCHIGVSGLCPSSTLTHTMGNSWWFKHLGPCHTCGRLEWVPKSRLSPRCCWHLRSEPEGIRGCSMFLSPQWINTFLNKLNLILNFQDPSFITGPHCQCWMIFFFFVQYVGTESGMMECFSFHEVVLLFLPS